MTRTKIPWADYSWNPITGCTAVSEGCAHCYACAAHTMRHKAHREGKKMPAQYAKPFSSVQFHPDRLLEPLRLKTPSVIFCCSTSDIYQHDVYLAWIDSILEVMSACPRHTFIVLTKRPERIERMLYGTTMECPARELGGGDYVPNLWIGISAENQARYDERWPLLCNVVPSGNRVVSIEPMLGPVQYLYNATHHKRCVCEYPDWVIAGPETGSSARPFRNRWFEDLQDQCRVNSIPFFDKRTTAGNPVRQWPASMNKHNNRATS